MAVRTNVTDVRTIINTSLEDVDIQSYITSASLMIDTYMSESELSSSILQEMEKWLVAHLISVSRERAAQSESVGNASITYSGKFGEGLKSTSYGQMVLMLDTESLLSEGKRTITINSIKSFD